jgi:multidrug efflux pump subunit AcrB
MNQQFGKLMYEATLDSGVARLRPILMITIAMIAGMLPIALGIGAGSQTLRPMAMAVIGGLMTSGLLTLVVIPLVFTYMDGLQIWIFNLMRGKKRGEGRSIRL